MPGYLLDYLQGLLNGKVDRDPRSAGNAFVDAAGRTEPMPDELPEPSGALRAWAEEKLGLPQQPGRMSTSTKPIQQSLHEECRLEQEAPEPGRRQNLFL